MSVRDRLADPWGLLLAATAGGLTWAVLPGAGLAVPIGIGVAAAVYVAKVVADALLGTEDPTPAPRPPSPTELPEPRRGTQARTLLDRAERALQALDQTVESAPASATREQLRAVRDEATATRAGIRRLAGQATAFEDAMERIPATSLTADREQLAAAARTARAADVAAQHRAALDGVEQQLAAYERLAAAREITLARLQTTALGVEGLGTRAIELLAMAAGTDHLPDDRRVDELAGELEALRTGIADVLTRTRPTLSSDTA